MTLGFRAVCFSTPVFGLVALSLQQGQVLV